jgi:osmotically-inducible protein OsmY
MAQLKVSDTDLLEQINHIIRQYPPLMQDRHYITVQVSNGRVSLCGHTRTAITRAYLVDAVRRLPGVVQLDDSGLYSDDRLRLEISRRIPVGVYVNVDHGVVLLTGHLPEGEDKNQPIADIHAIKGIRGVQTAFNGQE